jgi:hypothetical protein
MSVIVPSHEVRRLPTLMANLEDNAVTIRLTGPISAHCDSVSDLCVHGTPSKN